LNVLIERAHYMNPQNQTYPLNKRGTLRDKLHELGDKIKVNVPKPMGLSDGGVNPIIRSNSRELPPVPKPRPIDDKRHSSPHRITLSMTSFDLSTPLSNGEVKKTFGINLKKTGDLETLVRKDSRDMPPVPLKKSTPTTTSRPTTPTTDAPKDEKLLFDFVVVVKLESINGGQVDPNAAKRIQYDNDGLPIATMNPIITYSFPPTNVQKKENKNLMQSIPLFCFPDIDLVEPLTTLESKTYSFVLTDLDGSRRFGYCKRMLPPGSGKRWPETYCIISSQ
jgi:hypothetical protein